MHFLIIRGKPGAFEKEFEWEKKCKDFYYITVILV